MTYEFFRVIDATHDDPTVYPVLSAPGDPRPFEWELSDGRSPLEFSTKRMTISEYTGNGWTQTKGFTDLTFTVCITDARVVVYCEKFEKGGGWRGFGLGGLAVAAMANAVSHARAAARRKGKVLVTQVRYPWIAQVAAPADKHGRQRALRIVVNSGTDDAPVIRALDLGINERSEPAKWAASLARLAADKRCATVAGSELAACQAIAAGTDQAGQPHWDLPGAIRVGGPGSLPKPLPAQQSAPPAELEPAALQLVPAEQSVSEFEPAHARPAPVRPSSAPVRPAPAHAVAVSNDHIGTACTACGAPMLGAGRPCGRCGRSAGWT